MKFTLLVVGKNKTSYISEGLKDYNTRISKYIPFNIVELPGIKSTKKYSGRKLLEEEGKQIEKALPADAMLVLLDERGKQDTSEEFALWLQKEMTSGKRHLVFVIGGAWGFSDRLYSRADLTLSLSKMTLSHQIVRIVFAEQLYRALTIIKGEPYHHRS